VQFVRRRRILSPHLRNQFVAVEGALRDRSEVSDEGESDDLGKCVNIDRVGGRFAEP
jgi:hypothetical protein